MKLNPLVILLYSVLRHIIVTGLFAVLTLLSLPDEFREQVETAADFTAPVVGAFLVWLFLKYGVILLKKTGYIKTLVLFLGVSFLFPSCAGIEVTPDGCILGTYTRGNQTYLAGPCVGQKPGKDGKPQVDRFQVKWVNHDGQTLRATYWIEAKKKIEIEYQLANGIWIAWDSKSGVLIGPVPLEVEKAMAGKPEPVAEPNVLTNPLDLP